MHLSRFSARVRIIPLWIALFGFAVGENVLRVFALNRLSSGNAKLNAPFLLSEGIPAPLTPSCLFWWLFLSAVPTIIAAPFIGAIASSRFRWTAMVVAALTGLGLAVSTVVEQPANWPGCIGLLSLASVFFAASRFGVTPQAARQSQLPFPHVQALLMSAVVAGAGFGVWIGLSEVAERGMPLQLQTAHVGFGIAIIALLFARFPTEPALSIKQGLIGPYLRTARSIMTARHGRHSLFALWGLFVLLLATDLWLLPNGAHQAYILAVMIGLILGGLHGNAHRTLGRVPYAAFGLAGCAIWGAANNDWYGPGLGIAGFLGMMIVPLLTTYQIYQPAESQGHGAALLFAGCGLLALGLIGFLIAMQGDPGALRKFAGYGVLSLSLLGMILAWLVFFRAAFETTVEWILWPFYRVRAAGPGLPMLPWRGPYVIIANHAAWFDPLWLEKILPVPTVPMMTSKFYDLRVISWLMRRVIGTIRVPEATVRREAPELLQALAALDRREVLVVFPEGYLRRKEAQELRRFGRGIWQILKERPKTPVFPCWIEGNWGSFVSYFAGPPTKNKKIDFWRRIRIGIARPLILDPKTLEEHMTTRHTLMRACLEARAELGLPSIDPFNMPALESELSSEALKETEE